MSTRTEPRYRLDSRIATGGMGEVWRATDTVLDRDVAVKVLKPEYADDPTFRSRFQAEARHAAALHHPNVASVFDFGELEPDDGSGSPRPYLVMELVPGKPLAELLRAGEPIAPDRAAELVAQAAEGIASAHALGIVHRDVKPGNLLVTPRGQVKITDFGIARAGDGAALTQTGQVLGTPAYLSPEQAEGKPATPASDVYSLGVVLYECLAGRRPFTGDTPVATAIAHLHADPPPLPGSVPEHLRSVVATALAKDPQQRFASMADLAAALRGGQATAVAEAPTATRVLTGLVPAAAAADGRQGAGSGPGDRARPAWLPWAAAALAVLVVVVATSLALGRDEAPTASQGPATEQRAEPASNDGSGAGAEEPPAEEQADTFSLEEEDFLGMPKDAAKAELEARGLKVKDERLENPDGMPEDTVVRVAPTEDLEEGDRVTLTVWGPAPKDEGPGPRPGHDKDKPKGKGHGKDKD